MDNFFEILIYLIIIISFLSSFFKKKEQPKKTTPKKPSARPEESTYAQQSIPDSFEVAEKKEVQYDILKELEKIFKGEINYPTEAKTKQDDLQYSQDTYSDSDLTKLDSLEDKPSLEKRTPIERLTRIEDKSYGRSRRESKKPAKVDPSIEKQAEKFEKVLESMGKKNVITSELIKNIKEKQSLREYILFSEILGKPKALRR